MQTTANWGRRVLLLLAVVALGLGAVRLFVGRERSPSDVTPQGATADPAQPKFELTESAGPQLGAEEGAARKPVLNGPSDAQPEDFVGSRFEYMAPRTVQVDWSIVDWSGPLPSSILDELGLVANDLLVCLRTSGSGQLGECSVPIGPELAGHAHLTASAPVDMALFINGVEVDRVERLGTAADHDAETHRAKLRTEFFLPVETLRASLCKLELRAANELRELRHVELTELGGRRQVFRVKRGERAWTRTLPFGHYQLRALLDSGALVEDELVLEAASLQHTLQEAEPGEIELVVNVPKNVLPGSELVIYPRRVEWSQLLGATWSAYGFPSFALQAGASEHFHTRPCPPGTYDVVLRLRSGGLGGHSATHLGWIVVQPGQRSELNLILTGSEALTAPASLLVPSADNVSTNVVITTDGGRVVFVERIQGATRITLPVGSYVVHARRLDSPAVPQQHTLQRPLELTMTGATVELSFPKLTW